MKTDDEHRLSVDQAMVFADEAYSRSVVGSDRHTVLILYGMALLLRELVYLLISIRDELRGKRP